MHVITEQRLINSLITVAVSLCVFTVNAPAGRVPPQGPSLQKENAPPTPARPPFSGSHVAPRPVGSAVLETRGSETQQHLSHAADVWRTTGGGGQESKKESMSVCRGRQDNM